MSAAQEENVIKLFYLTDGMNFAIVIMQLIRYVWYVLCNSLPELGDGGGEVGGVGSHPKGFVLAVGVLDAMISVPGLLAFGPGQLWLKTLKYKNKNAQLNSTCPNSALQWLDTSGRQVTPAKIKHAYYHYIYHFGSTHFWVSQKLCGAII